jgi:hypothetical protein
MELAVIFAIGWVMSHAFSEKRDEYSASQDAHRERYLAKLKRDHPSWGHARRERYLQNAARRNALGHFAYLLRHGWSSTFNDIGEGWKKAREAHEEWRNEHPKGAKKRGWFATLKAGWKDRWARRPKSTGYYEPRPDLTPEPKREPKPQPETNNAKPIPAKPQAEPVWPGKVTVVTDTITGSTEPTNGRTPMEAPNLDAARSALNAKATAYRTDASSTEQLTADMIAGGMGADQDTMNHIAAMNEALATAAAHADAASGGLSKHQSGQEYANSGHAAKTEYLRTS